MKKTFLFISIIFSINVGCMQIQIKDLSIAETHKNQFPMVVILSVDFEDNRFSECVQNDLKDEFPELTFFPGNKFRDALYPWLEPNTFPRDISELSSILTEKLIQTRIIDLGVELLIYVRGHTQSRFEVVGTSTMGVGLAAAGISIDRKTHLSTTVWDLKENVFVCDTAANIMGSTGCCFGIPLTIATPESDACKKNAKQISNCLTEKGFYIKK